MRFGGAAPDVRDFQEACRLATAKALQGPDPLRNAQVVQILASGRVSPQQAADVLGKRLQQKRPHKQYLAVRLIGDVRPGPPALPRRGRPRTRRAGIARRPDEVCVPCQVLVAHPDLRPALVKHVLAAQKAPMNRRASAACSPQAALGSARAARPISRAALFLRAGTATRCRSSSASRRPRTSCCRARAPTGTPAPRPARPRRTRRARPAPRRRPRARSAHRASASGAGSWRRP